MANTQTGGRIVAVAPPPRWAVAAAWTVPALTLPSGLWRLTGFTSPEHTIGTDGWWYPPLLSVVAFAVAFLTVGLVRPWGLVFPRWIPALGRRPVPARLVTLIARIGAIIIILLTIYGVSGALGFNPRGPVLIGEDDPTSTPPGTEVEILYTPLLAWGPLLLAVAHNYRQRTKSP